MLAEQGAFPVYFKTKPHPMITDGPNVLTRAMRNLSGFLTAQKFTLQR